METGRLSNEYDVVQSNRMPPAESQETTSQYKDFLFESPGFEARLSTQPHRLSTTKNSPLCRTIIILIRGIKTIVRYHPLDGSVKLLSLSCLTYLTLASSYHNP